MLGKTFRKRINTKFLEFLAFPFIKLSLNPLVVSFLGIPLAVIAAFFISQKLFLFGFIFAILSLLMDFIDGAVARALNKASLLGNYLETMFDKIVEFFLFLGCAFLYPVAAMLAMGFSFIESYAKPRVALVIITDNRDWPAIGEHADRMLVLLISILISAFYEKIFGIHLLELGLYLIAVITFIGSVQRMLFAKKLIEEAKRKGNILPYLKKSEAARE